MVAFEDLSGILVLQNSCSSFCGVKEQVDTDGEVRGIQETDILLFDPFACFSQVVLPACGPNHHDLTRADASLDISQNSLGCCEINYGVYVTQSLRGEGSGSGIVLRAQQSNVMSAFARHLHDQRASFAATQNKKIHKNPSMVYCEMKQQAAAAEVVPFPLSTTSAYLHRV